MKTDLSATFLHKPASEAAPTLPVSPHQKRTRRRWLIIGGVGVAVVAYLILMGSALSEQFRSPISEMKDGWFRIRDREAKFQVDLPKSPSKRARGSMITYENYIGQRYSVVVHADSRARQLLKNTASSLLRTAMQADAAQGSVTLLDNGVVDSKTQWIEYQVQLNGGAERSIMRRKLHLHGTQSLELTVIGSEADVMSQDVDRIMNSVVWFARPAD